MVSTINAQKDDENKGRKVTLPLRDEVMQVFFFPLLLDMYFCTQDIFCNGNGLRLKKQK